MYIKMLGYKKSLGRNMLGHKMALGKEMLGSKSPLANIVDKEELKKDLEKKVSAGVEKRIRGAGWKLGNYA